MFRLGAFQRASFQNKLKAMRALKLHSFGQNDHLEFLKKKYDSLKKRVLGNDKLTETVKNTELKTLSKTLKKAKKDAANNLY